LSAYEKFLFIPSGSDAEDVSAHAVERLHDLRLANELSLDQLNILQEMVTLPVFVAFAFLYMQQPLKPDFLWAALCILGAVYFIFR
jgi:hypothetical protein